MLLAASSLSSRLLTVFPRPPPLTPESHFGLRHSVPTKLLHFFASVRNCGLVRLDMRQSAVGGASGRFLDGGLCSVHPSSSSVLPFLRHRPPVRPQGEAPTGRGSTWSPHCRLVAVVASSLDRFKFDFPLCEASCADSSVIWVLFYVQVNTVLSCCNFQENAWSLRTVGPLLIKLLESDSDASSRRAPVQDALLL